jgi:hypothetical protein
MIGAPASRSQTVVRRTWDHAGLGQIWRWVAATAPVQQLCSTMLFNRHGAPLVSATEAAGRAMPEARAAAALSGRGCCRLAYVGLVQLGADCAETGMWLLMMMMVLWLCCCCCELPEGS